MKNQNYPQSLLVKGWPTIKPSFYTLQDGVIIRPYFMDKHLFHVPPISCKSNYEDMHTNLQKNGSPNCVIGVELDEPCFLSPCFFMKETEKSRDIGRSCWTILVKAPLQLSLFS